MYGCTYIHMYIRTHACKHECTHTDILSLTDPDFPRPEENVCLS